MSDRRTNAIRQTIAYGIPLLGVLLAIGLGRCTLGCAPPPKSATYGGELATCTAAAKAREEQGAITKVEACQESIACENAVRARHDRPARRFSLDCK